MLNIKDISFVISFELLLFIFCLLMHFAATFKPGNEIGLSIIALKMTVDRMWGG